MRQFEVPLCALTLAAIAGVFILTGCAPFKTEKPEADSVQALADEYLEALLERSPEIATYYGIPGRSHDRLTDNSLAALRAWEEREDAWLARLRQLESELEPGSPDWAIYGILLETLEAESAVRVCRNELWKVSQMSGWQTEIPYILEIQPVGTEELRRQALARVGGLDRYIDSEVANAREGLSLGYSSPRRSVELVAEQIEILLDPDSPLGSPARRDTDPNFQAAYTKILEQNIQPAMRRYLDFLLTEYLPKARETIAVATNPEGADCYRAASRYYSTLEVPPQEIHDLGLRQMALIQHEMQEIAERSFDTADVPTLLNRLTTDREFTFSTPKEIIEFSEAAMDRAWQAMPRFFGRVPAARVVIEPYPAYLEDSGTGEYASPAEDGSRPGLYYIPVTDPENRPRVIYESLAFHETIPGHHLQGTIALELGQDAHPLTRYLYNSGYAEGWGLYAERLADEMGLYSSDLTRMGMLGDQAARAARLVIDTGIHVLGWSRQQAIDYMMTHTTWTAGDIESEVDRYVIMPGQANAYMLGMLKIKELRARAEEALGPDFRIADFHDRILENGSVTLGMLEEKIEAWIEAD